MSILDVHLISINVRIYPIKFYPVKITHIQGNEMLQINFHNKFKFMYLVFLSMLCAVMVACSGGGTAAGSTPPTPEGPQLVISSFTESSLAIGGSTTVNVSIANLTSSESTVVAINNDASSVISISPTNCTLSVSANLCVITVTGVGAGSGTFSASATGLTSVTSGAITVTAAPASSGILFGTIGGLVFNSGSLLAGSSSLATIDNSQVQGLVIDSDNNIYAGTFGNGFNGFGAGKVFKYITSAGYWLMLGGSGVGGSLDGSAVNTLAIDSNNNLYAGTEAGNVFKYANGIWSQVGLLLNDPIKAMALDANNNIYVGTQNAGEVFKYVSGSWQSLGIPDATPVQSLAINSSGDIYAATYGNPDGQVYFYAGGSTWNAISAFTDGPVNAVAVNSTNVYAGTTGGNVYEYASSAWTQLGISPDTTAVTELMVNDTDVYAGTEGSSYNGQVFRYTGVFWDQLGSLNNGGISVITLRESSLYTSTVNAGGNSQGMVYTYSANAWSPVGTGALDGTSIYSTAVDSSGNFYAGTQNNVFKYTASSKVWVLFGNIAALDGSGVFALATYGTTLYAGAVDGNVFRSNGSGNWVQLGASRVDSTLSSLAVNLSGELYTSINDSNAANNDGTVWKYNTTTGRWVKIDGTGTGGSLDASAINSLTFDESGNLYAATAGSGAGGLVWEYPVGGSAWNIVGLGTLDGSAVTTITTDSSLNLYAGTNNGNVFKYNGSYWVPLSSAPLDGSGVSSFAFDGDANLYATTYGGLVWKYVKSTNLWINTNYGIGLSINTNGSSGF